MNHYTSALTSFGYYSNCTILKQLTNKTEGVFLDKEHLKIRPKQIHFTNVTIVTLIPAPTHGNKNNFKRMVFYILKRCSRSK